MLGDLEGRIDAVLDAGRTQVGIESTILACVGGQPVLLRPGGIARDEIERIVGPLAAHEEGRIHAPGMLASHYAPRAGLRLGALAMEEGEAGLDFGARFGGKVLDLSPSGDTVEAAANLYAFLRRLDAAAPRRIAVAPIPHTGLGEAINDRLRRAAATAPLGAFVENAFFRYSPADPKAHRRIRTAAAARLAGPPGIDMSSGVRPGMSAIYEIDRPA